MYIKSPKPEDEFFEFSSLQGTSLSSSCDVQGAVPGTKESEKKTTRPCSGGVQRLVREPAGGSSCSYHVASASREKGRGCQEREREERNVEETLVISLTPVEFSTC